MKKRLRNYFNFIAHYRVHFITWLFFIFYEVVITGLLRGQFATVGNYVIFYIFNIILFYFHAHVVMPAAKIKTKHVIWRLPLLIAAEVIVYVPLVLYTAKFFVKYAGLILYAPVIFDQRTILSTVWRAIYFIFFSLGYYFLINYIKERKIAQEAEKERLLMIIENQSVQAELIKSQHAHLKAQINPHFLFNTLSFIYSSTRKVAPEAAETIMTLSDMMRYAIQDDSERTFTDLILEIEQVENLIKLHQIKSENKFNIIFEYDEHLAEVQIIPLVLITLVENMFKHGDLLQEEHPALISVDLAQNVLIIETQNLINLKAKPTSHHIGLENIKKRLKMVYEEKAGLQISRISNNYFNVILSIELD
jgi:two-component system LytT family sensor kinase